MADTDESHVIAQTPSANLRPDHASLRPRASPRPSEAKKASDNEPVLSEDTAFVCKPSLPESNSKDVRDDVRLGPNSPVRGTLQPSTSHESSGDIEVVNPHAPGAGIGRVAREKQYFRFMDLPSELRLAIYRMALCQPDPILLHIQQARSAQEGTAVATSFSRSNSSSSNDGDGRSLILGSSISDAEVGEMLLFPSRRNSQTGPAFSDLVESQSINSRRSNRQSGRRGGGGNENSPVDGHKLLRPLVPAFLRVSQQIYREARPVLYSDNEFILRLDSALATLSTLHQRSRSLIKHVRLDIPTHHEILEGFADLVRLGLRYCWGLKTFTISLPAMFLGENGGVGMNSTINVYANAFHILRWLPKGCRVVLQGPVCEEIKRVVEENGRLAVLLDEKGYQRRQHAMQERNQSPMSKVGPATRNFR